jgi:hypothetical protein
MTSATPWLGTKRVAFVPLFRSNAAPPDQIPPNWENVILNRVLFNPRPEANGADRSLSAWLQAVSLRRADIEPLVLPMQTIARQNVLPWDLDGIPWEGITLGQFLRNQGVQAAQLVMLGQRPSGTSAGFWSRVVMAESNGVWLMELIHSLTRFVDLYPFTNDTDPVNRNIGAFDEMSATSQTHPTIFTKNELGWLGAGCIGRYQFGISSGHGFILLNNSAPPQFTPPDCTSGGVFAVRIGDDFPYVMVESRRKNDQFETGMPSTADPQEMGITSEGVIAYRVQIRNATNNVREGGKIPLYLLTQTALHAGESTVLDNGVTLTVTAATPKGHIIRLEEPIVIEPGTVIVPWVSGANAQDARRALEEKGLVADFSGPMLNSEVLNQTPDGQTAVQKGSTVHLFMHKITNQ